MGIEIIGRLFFLQKCDIQGVHPLWDPKEIGITEKVFRLGKKQRHHSKVEKWEFF